jgi:hypothetical protein
MGDGLWAAATPHGDKFRVMENPRKPSVYLERPRRLTSAARPNLFQPGLPKKL